jgi:hypothetical protein
MQTPDIIQTLLLYLVNVERFYLIGIAARTRCLHDAQTYEPPQAPGRMELRKDDGLKFPPDNRT